MVLFEVEREHIMRARTMQVDRSKVDIEERVGVPLHRPTLPPTIHKRLRERRKMMNKRKEKIRHFL